jgi:hypothetical protein
VEWMKTSSFLIVLRVWASTAILREKSQTR